MMAHGWTHPTNTWVFTLPHSLAPGVAIEPYNWTTAETLLGKILTSLDKRVVIADPSSFLLLPALNRDTKTETAANNLGPLGEKPKKS